MDAVKKDCEEGCLEVAKAGGYAMQQFEQELAEKFEELERNLNRAVAVVEGKIQRLINGE